MTTFGKETKYFAVEKGRICQFACCTKWLCRNKKLYTLHTHTYCTQQRTTNNTVVSKSVFYVNTCMCVVQITNEYYDKRTFIQWFIKFVQQMKSSLTNRKCYNSQWCVDLCAFKILIEIYIYIKRANTYSVWIIRVWIRETDAVCDMQTYQLQFAINNNSLPSIREMLITSLICIETKRN